ncbi:MAG: choline transporter, partial [Deltaproteobacteria bacterium]
MIGGFLNLSIGIEFNQTTQILIVVTFAVATAFIVAFNLKAGLKKLADFNLYLLYGVVFLCFFISGAAQFMMDTTSTAFGLLFNNFFKISLWTDSIRQEGFPQGWTIFYWAWWLIYAPTMGIFLAKISKGRSIRQTGLTIIAAGSVGCWLLYIVFGNYGLYLD